MTTHQTLAPSPPLLSGDKSRRLHSFVVRRIHPRTRYGGGDTENPKSLRDDRDAPNARTTNAWSAFPTFSEHHEAGFGQGLRAPGVMWAAAAHVHFAARVHSGT